jgi:VanZ family protein
MGQYKQHRFCSLRFGCARKAILMSIVYGICIEIMQEYLWADRHADLLDVIANTIGSIAGVLYFRLAFREQMNFK